MTGDLAWKVAEAIRHAEQRRERLVLLAGPASRSKTAALEETAEQTDAPLINVNLELSRRLIDLASFQRPLQVRRLLGEAIAETGSNVVLLDRLELLFDPSLRQDPLRLLKDLSRQRTLVAAWSGLADRRHILYAEPGHPEYRRHEIEDTSVVTFKGVAG